MWSVGIFETRTGAPVLRVPVSAGSWARRLTGSGQGSHTIPLYQSGIPRSLVREITRGNKYTIAQLWGDHVAYAGVITNRKYDAASRKLTLQSTELRAAIMNQRMLFGVLDYDPAANVLVVSGRSYSAAVRAVLMKALGVSSEWALPIDIPADGAGGFSATWRKEETLMWEDHLAQIEADGCEIDFRPYLSGGNLRWEARVQYTVTAGVPTDLAAKAPGSVVLDLTVEDDYAKQLTGVLGFGKGQGQDKPFKFAPTGGSGAVEIPVRDMKVTFPDIDDPTRLQAAVNAAYAARKDPVQQWSFGLHVWPSGPALADPGRLLNLWVYGDEFIPDGLHQKRVIALSGDLGFTVTPEVQDG